MSKIAKARKEKHLTQAKLGELVGVGQAAVAHWEKDRRQPSVATLKKIAAALGVRVETLI